LRAGKQAPESSAAQRVPAGLAIDFIKLKKCFTVNPQF
jgi:hypothetical protein